ncbi:hypothetical protein ABVK50_05075 [Mesorhizobium sp. WSM2240]|uniref:Uncharacterized protein n=1 Tax=Mesorhizobium sp. WSM2240 TaxID=3228851 RepID=A0AAU8CSH1_9HYPH
MDRAEWHTTADLDVQENITPILLPYLRSQRLSDPGFETYGTIIYAVCEA